jgi:hypothetical protein
MRRWTRRAAWCCAGLALAGGASPLGAYPWKKVTAAAVALALWSGGQAWPPDAAGAGGAPRPLPGSWAGPDAPGRHPFALPEALAGEDDASVPMAGTCAEDCETRFNQGLIHCESYLQLRALRNLCLSNLLAEEETCALDCGGR